MLLLLVLLLLPPLHQQLANTLLHLCWGLAPLLNLLSYVVCIPAAALTIWISAALGRSIQTQIACDLLVHNRYDVHFTGKLGKLNDWCG